MTGVLVLCSGDTLALAATGLVGDEHAAANVSSAAPATIRVLFTARAAKWHVFMARLGIRKCRQAHHGPAGSAATLQFRAANPLITMGHDATV